MKAFLAALAAIFGWFIGNVPGLVVALLIFMLLDFATGMASAYVHGEISSRIGFRGIARKFVIIGIVVAGYMMDHFMLGEVLGLVDFPLSVGTLCATFYIFNEAVSICENAVILGIPIPAKFLALLNSQTEEKEDASKK